MTTPLTVTGRPVAGMPRKSPRCVPVQVNRVTTFVAGGDGFVGDPVDVGEGGAHHGDDLFEAFAALALAGERVELDEVFGDDLVADLVAALVDDFVDEALDDGGVVAWVGSVRGVHQCHFTGSRPKDLSCCWMAGLVSQSRKCRASFCWWLDLRMTPACWMGG